MKAFRLLKWFLVLAVMAAMVVGAYLYQQRQAGGGFAWGARDEQAGAAAGETRRPPSEELVCPGYVDVLGGVTPLATAQPYRIVEVRVADNDQVEAGQELLRFDDVLQQEAVAEAQTLVNAAQQKLKLAHRTPEKHELLIQQAQAAVDAARATWEIARHREAVQAIAPSPPPAGDRQATGQPATTAAADSQEDDAEKRKQREDAIAEEQVRMAEAGLRGEEARLTTLQLADPTDELQLLQAEIDHAQAKLRQAQVALDQCVLRAPRSGTVMRVLVSPGQIIGPMQAAIHFASDEARIVRVEIEQAYVDQVSAGCSAVIYDDRQPDRRWQGHVLRLSQWYSRPRAIFDETTALADVRTVECVVAIEGETSDLRIGQRVWTRIKRTQPAPAPTEPRADADAAPQEKDSPGTQQEPAKEPPAEADDGPTGTHPHPQQDAETRR